MGDVFFFFKQKTAYEMRISDWSSDVCSSDLVRQLVRADAPECLTAPHRRGFVGEHQAVAVDDEAGVLHRARPEIRRGQVVELGEQIGRASCRERVCQYV